MPPRPNIVLIMTDQQRGDCLSIENHPVLQTPSMDAIASNGVRFTRAYSTCPVCIPARRSLLSGQFPATHGLLNYQDGLDWHPKATLPQVLRDHGYHTLLVGRSMHQHPVRKRFGYEEMKIYAGYGEGNDYLEWLRANSTMNDPQWMGGGVMHNDWTARPFHLPEPLHFTNWVVDESLRSLRRRDPACPLFLTVSFIAPHPPLQPPDFYLQRYLRTGVPEPVYGDWAQPPSPGSEGDPVAPNRVHLRGEALLSARAAYYGLINHVDDQIRRIFNPVDGAPSLLGPNTVYLFTSDHGEMLGDHYMWRKQQPYEPSARVPLLIRGPQQLGFKPGAVLDQPACLEDIMPTLLDLADIPIPASVDGRSLAPLLRGESVAWREFVHIEYAPNYHCLTDGKTKYIWFAAKGNEQLFDLTNDPSELRNLASLPEHRSTLDAWRGRLARHLKNRAEGFSDGERLIPGRPYKGALPHVSSMN